MDKSSEPSRSSVLSPAASAPSHGKDELELSQFPAPVQMIGEDGAFYRLNVESVGMNDPFTLISIIGPQCSGKSYLLNHIFGTNFEVMNAAKGRHQTTKGIWLSKSTIPDFLVLDVEGSDGKEKQGGEKALRGSIRVQRLLDIQDQLSYQSQIARFLLQLSNLIMVNMRLQDINRQLGGNSTLLPAIFQEKSKIKSAQTNILVVIRGYDNETPVELLQLDVLENMKKLWKSSVPEESPMFEECIELFIVALADKSEEQEFGQGVFELKQKLIKGCFTSIRQDFASKANGIWQSIRLNQQLKIPVHDHMVATSTINCERTIKFIIDKLETFQGYDSLVASTSSKEFWEAYTCLSTITSTYFDTETELCDITVRNKKHQELKQTMLERVDPFHRNILTRQNEEMQEKYKKLIREKFSQAEDPMLIVDDSVKKCMEELAETCRYMSMMNKDAYLLFLESFQSELRDYAHNEAELIKGKRETAKYELARDELARKASTLNKEAEDLQQELIRGKENFNKDKEIARESLEEERKYALASNQRAREESEKESENLRRKLESLKRQQERMIRERRQRDEARFRKANQIARTMFTVAGGLAAGFLGMPIPVPPMQYGPTRPNIPYEDTCDNSAPVDGTPELHYGYQVQSPPIITDVTGEQPEDNYDQGQMDCQ